MSEICNEPWRVERERYLLVECVSQCLRVTILIEKALTHSIIGGFFTVYKTYGFGFSEHVYALALERELVLRSHRIAREFQVPVAYRGITLTTQRLDMVVDEKVVLELKATPALHRSAAQQLYNYLRVSPFEVGLLLHFGPEPYFERLVDTKHAATVQATPAT